MTSTVTQPSGARVSDSAETWSPVYTFSDREKVEQYVAANPSARTLLIEAPARVAALFGADTPIRLEVRTDPETPCPPELWALILTDMQTPEKTLAAEQNLRRLHSDWLIQLPRALSGCACFDVEYA